MSHPALFVRAHSFKGDSYTSYWSNGHHSWGPLSVATVFSQDDLAALNRLDPSFRIYVPKEGEWEQLPNTLKEKSDIEQIADLMGEPDAG